MSEFAPGFASEDDREALIDLHRAAVGNEFVTLEDFEHRYLDHPFGRVTIPVLRASDGSLAGAVWIFPMRLSIGGTETEVGNAANLHIHPKYRDTFAYTILSRHLGRTIREQVPLHFSVVSLQIYNQRLNAEPGSVTTLPWLVRVLDPTALANRYGKAKGRSLVEPFLRMGGHMMFGRRPSVDTGQVRVQGLPEFDERFDTFWGSIRSQYPITLVRNREYLRWRFANVALRSYEIFVAETPARMLGYLVLRRMKNRQVGFGYIVDFVVVDGPAGSQAGAALLAAAEEHCREHDVTVLSTAMTGLAHGTSLLMKAGFHANPFPRLRFFRQLWPLPLTCAVFAHERTEVCSTARRAADWFLTLAHHEVI